MDGLVSTLTPALTSIQTMITIGPKKEPSSNVRLLETIHTTRAHKKSFITIAHHHSCHSTSLRRAECSIIRSFVWRRSGALYKLGTRNEWPYTHTHHSGLMLGEHLQFMQIGCWISVFPPFFPSEVFKRHGFTCRNAGDAG